MGKEKKEKERKGGNKGEEEGLAKREVYTNSGGKKRIFGYIPVRA